MNKFMFGENHDPDYLMCLRTKIESKFITKEHNTKSTSMLRRGSKPSDEFRMAVYPGHFEKHTILSHERPQPPYKTKPMFGNERS
jgi:hypothetical protein